MTDNKERAALNEAAFSAADIAMHKKHPFHDDNVRFHDVGALLGYAHEFIQAYQAALASRQGEWMDTRTINQMMIDGDIPRPRASHQGEEVGENGLKCCPFCGSSAVEKIKDFGRTFRTSVVRCKKCPAEVAECGLDARVYWNTRASSPTNQEK